VFITLHGAANAVTGSCYLIETDKARVLVDCGLFQGSKRLEKFNFIPKSIMAEKVEAVVLTHGHLDHCGRLPLLVKAGFRGPIYGTSGTLDIARLIISDAAKIQVDDTNRENRKRIKAGQPTIKPLFGIKDAEKVFPLFYTLPYNSDTKIADEITIRLVEAGHILGSSSVIMTQKSKTQQLKLVFSGDLGQVNIPINRDPAVMEKADLVFLESTYGGREHPPYEQSVQLMIDLIKETIAKKGKILIPTFAVGRTQQLLYHLAQMFHSGAVEPFPIYLDSPMAQAATAIYSDHLDIMDPEAKALFSQGQLHKQLPTLKYCATAEESQALNALTGLASFLPELACAMPVEFAPFRHNLGIAETLVLIVGFQAKDSMGRRLLDGEPIKIFGESINVRAKIANVQGFSAHAGQSDLLHWVEPIAKSGARIVLTHGENHQLHELKSEIKAKFGIEAEIPSQGDRLSIGEEQD
jgi:metallo-beta-lactamase family protein